MLFERARVSCLKENKKGDDVGEVEPGLARHHMRSANMVERQRYSIPANVTDPLLVVVSSNSSKYITLYCYIYKRVKCK